MTKTKQKYTPRHNKYKEYIETIEKDVLKNLVKNGDKLFKLLLAPEDMVTLHMAKKLINSSTFVKINCKAYLTENMAIYLAYLASNLGIITYEYAYASWFLYMTTTFSGLKKLYKVVFKNPILGIFFYASFYAQALGDADKSKFNAVSKKLGIPTHEDLLDKKYLNVFVDKISDVFNGTRISGYKMTIRQVLRQVAGIFIAGQIEKAGEKIGKIILEAVQGSKEEIKNLEYAAVVITNKDVFEETDYLEWVEYTKENKEKIVKKLKHKNKKKHKLQLQRVIERKSDGKIVCQDTCKGRTKTSIGCYCESDCGATFLLGKKEWCYVDPKKCKKAKNLPTFMGKKYDTCNSSKKTVPKCYTGARYMSCA